jgi:formylmethanofuran dehydrogenase subunit B
MLALAGLNRIQAEALTRHLTDIILSQTAFNKGLFVSKGELERVVIQIEARQKQFKQEMQVAHEVHYGTMSKEAERLNGQLDKFKADIKHEVRLFMGLVWGGIHR